MTNHGVAPLDFCLPNHGLGHQMSDYGETMW